jgi:hypothetical protein
LYWVDCNEQRIIDHQRTRISLSDPLTKQYYLRSQNISTTSRFKEAITVTKDMEHTVLLSPQRFRGFAGSLAIRQFLGNPIEPEPTDREDDED